jgi:hypothetical protein
MKIIGAAALLAALAVTGRGQTVIPPMIGAWQGDATVISSWTRARTIPVRITITADDRVTGTVGDATLVNAMLLKNRGDAAQSLPWKTAYIVEANLHGAIVNKDNVFRSSVQIALDWRDDHFAGGFKTSGWKVGANEARAVFADLVLYRAPLLVTCDLLDQTRR